MTNKPLVIAICGKSAAGKDTLAKELTIELRNQGWKVNRLVSDTSRPPREGEIADVDYHFISQRAFENNIQHDRYLEYSKFNGWYYGTEEVSLQKGIINIGVFNAKGIQSLEKLQWIVNVVPVYIQIGFLERMRRSYNRENKFKLEYLRRAWRDSKDFKYIEDFIHCNFANHLVLETDNLNEQISQIIRKLKQRGLIQRLAKNI